MACHPSRLGHSSMVGAQRAHTNQEGDSFRSAQMSDLKRHRQGCHCQTQNQGGSYRRGPTPGRGGPTPPGCRGPEVQGKGKSHCPAGHWISTTPKPKSLPRSGMSLTGPPLLFSQLRRLLPPEVATALHRQPPLPSRRRCSFRQPSRLRAAVQTDRLMGCICSERNLPRAR